MGARIAMARLAKMNLKFVFAFEGLGFTVGYFRRAAGASNLMAICARRLGVVKIGINRGDGAISDLCWAEQAVRAMRWPLDWTETAR